MGPAARNNELDNCLHPSLMEVELLCSFPPVVDTLGMDEAIVKVRSVGREAVLTWQGVLARHV